MHRVDMHHVAMHHVDMHRAVPMMLHCVNMCLLLLQLLLPKAWLLLLVNMHLTDAFAPLPSAPFVVALLLGDADAAHFQL